MESSDFPYLSFAFHFVCSKKSFLNETQSATESTSDGSPQSCGADRSLGFSSPIHSQTLTEDHELGSERNIFRAIATLNTCPSSRMSSESSYSDEKKSCRNSILSSSRRHHKYYKTELCRSWDECGYCRYGSNCQFAHGINELVTIARHPKYKTEACRSYAKFGCCYYGARCRFLHKNEATTIPETTGLLRNWSGQVVFRRLPIFVLLSMGHIIDLPSKEMSTTIFSFLALNSRFVRVLFIKPDVAE